MTRQGGCDGPMILAGAAAIGRPVVGLTRLRHEIVKRSRRDGLAGEEH